MAKVKWTKTPMLRPGRYSLYQVMEKICEVIEEEPRRFDMGDWVMMLRGQNRGMCSKSELEKKKIPDCGTIGCFAGWGGVLLRGREMPGYRFLKLFGVEREATYVYEYRDPVINVLDDLFGERYSKANPGTRAYAREILGKFKRFMKENREALEKYHTVVAPRRRAA